MVFKMKTSKKQIRDKYPNATLISCDDKGHKKGCYIKLKDDAIECSEEKQVVLDLNKKGEIVGIDLDWQ